MKRTLAVAHLALISPAVLFLTAVLVQRLQNEPGLTAQHIVMWYAERMWTLWILLLALPISVLISGFISLLRDSSDRTQVASILQKAFAGLHPAGARTSVAVTTVTAAVIVGIVILHMLAN
jgi:O-antigen/teichoic acid export membrane protein